MKHNENFISNTLIKHDEEIDPFGQNWTEIVAKIKETSPFRNFVTYSVKFLMQILLLKYFR